MLSKQESIKRSLLPVTRQASSIESTCWASVILRSAKDYWLWTQRQPTFPCLVLSHCFLLTSLSIKLWQHSSLLFNPGVWSRHFTRLHPLGAIIWNQGKTQRAGVITENVDSFPEGLSLSTLCSLSGVRVISSSGGYYVRFLKKKIPWKTCSAIIYSERNEGSQGFPNEPEV